VKTPKQPIRTLGRFASQPWGKVLPVLIGTVFVLAVLPVFAADHAANLVGSRRLVSFKSVPVDGAEARDILGQNTKGFLVFLPQGRMTALITADAPIRSGAHVDETVHRVVGYSGRYRIEGDQLIARIDVASNETWPGSEQVRHFSLQGATLTIKGAPQDSLLFPGKKAIGTLIWERDSQ
jgi:hypothetical protein